MHVIRCLPSIALIGMLASCSTEPSRVPAIGVAYAGPATLTLRREIDPRSATVAVARHGDKLDIVQKRRRFLKVRTRSGAEGWTEERLLLAPDEVNDLKGLADQARTLPSQGVASTYDVLNVHTAPQRESPSFLQIKEGEKFDVLERRLSPRVAPPRQPLVVPLPKRVAVPKKPAKTPRVPPPPMPPAPGLPGNWLELSKTPVQIEAASEPAPENEPEPVAMDDWSFVRTKSGQSGWVLSRRLFMAIPDEVAQYAEGRRITAYFSLGEVQDGDQVKHHWLWTTVGQPLQPYDFDSFRVFIWNLRRHRYETAHIERNVIGHFPVLLHPVRYAINAKAAEPATYPGFSVCLERNGTRVRRSYAFLSNIVRFAGEKPCAAATLERPEESDSTTKLAASQDPEPQNPASFSARIKGRVSAWRKRFFGR
jgi:hypothetical protein